MHHRMTTGVKKFSDLSNEEGKALATKYLDEVIGHGQGYQNVDPGSGFLEPLMALRELRDRIALSQLPLETAEDVVEPLSAFVSTLEMYDPTVTDQLRTFMQVMRAGIAVSSQRPPYAPMQFINDARSEIIDVVGRYRRIIADFQKHPNDESAIHALLYGQILLTETLGKTMITELKDMLTVHNLNSKYDAAEVYSINQSFKLSGGTITDVEAIRHCLAHSKYDIIFIDGDWQIRFRNNAAEYTFDKVLTRSEFLRFIESMWNLYMGCYALLCAAMISSVTHTLLMK